jgi:hypothetical protein
LVTNHCAHKNQSAIQRQEANGGSNALLKVGGLGAMLSVWLLVWFARLLLVGGPLVGVVSVSFSIHKLESK